MLAILATPADAQNWTVPQTGYELLGNLQRDSADTATTDGLKTYSNGIAARAYVLGAFLNGVSNNLYCLRGGAEIKWNDVLIVVRAYLEQNTDVLGEAPSILVSDALSKAFPCSP